MSAERDKPPAPPSLAGAAWLAAPATQAVIAALAVAGFEGRVVGGTVRNALMGLPVSDIDIATAARPEDVIKACRDAGLTTVPTGLDHGTVTVVAHHTPVEVTTLRRDLATDGRRATVAFTTDWSEDAKRRDFTMNALYCDKDGDVHDYVGGYADLVARRVRFIGNADARIAEDYLRILRFFRFYAAFGSADPDPVAVSACARGIAGIGRLSAERIRAEMVKLLVAPGVIAAIRAMMDIGLLPIVLGSAPRPTVLGDVVKAEARAQETPDAMLRLSALAIAVQDDIARVTARLRLSNEERQALVVIDGSLAKREEIDARRARQMVYRGGAAPCRRLALALSAVSPRRTSEAAVLLATAKSWTPPMLPVSGADLIAAGLKAGPLIGKLLDEIENWWVELDFPEEGMVRTRLTASIQETRPSSVC